MKQIYHEKAALMEATEQVGLGAVKAEAAALETQGTLGTGH